MPADQIGENAGFSLLEEKEAEENGVTADAGSRGELRVEPRPSK